MFKVLVPLFVCIVLAAGAPPPKPKVDVRIYTQGKSQAFMVGTNNYGITHESFYGHGLLTASVNGDTVTWINSNCEKTTGERDQILEHAIEDIGAHSTNVVYLGHDNKYMVANANVTTFGTDVSPPPAPDMPGEFFKVFISNEYAIFVHKNGQVEMKPAKCIDTVVEKTLVDAMIKQEKEFSSRFFH